MRISHCVAVVILIAVAGIGCARRPSAFTEDEHRDLLFSPPPGKASIFVVRSGYVGREYMMPVVDERVLGGLLPRTYLRVDVEPGAHRIFGSFTGVDRSPPLEVALSPGEVAFAQALRVYPSVVPTTEIRSLSAELGQEKIRRSRTGVAFAPAPRLPTRTTRRQAESFEPSTGKGLVYVIRRGMHDRRPDSAAPDADDDAPSKLAVILDGQVVALLGRRSYIAFELDPGSHSMVGAVFTTHALDPLEFQVLPGRSHYFEASTAGRKSQRHAPIESLRQGEGRAMLRSNRVAWLE